MIKTYLQWVGTGYYATISDFVIDVRKRGLKKRLPNARTAASFAKNDVAIFLVHNNGRLRQCLVCAEQSVCSLCFGQDDNCPRCKGLGALERGTGGYAVVDGEKWTFLRYVKMKRNYRHEFWDTEHTIGEISCCETCGGRGQVPFGEVFGFYIPEEYRFENGCYAIARLEESQKVLELKREVLTKIGDPPVEHIGGFVLLEEPFSYIDKHFRGVKSWEPPVFIADKVGTPPLEGIA